MTGLPLSHGRPIGSVAVRGNVFDLDGDDIATAQLAVDCKIKHRKVARSPLHLQPRPDRPDVLRSQRRLGSDQLTLVPGECAVAVNSRSLQQDQAWSVSSVAEEDSMRRTLPKPLNLRLLCTARACASRLPSTAEPFGRNTPVS
jgi:hypothetical protein